MKRQFLFARGLGLVAVFAGCLASLGCATSFTGDPHVPGGPAGCVAKCQAWRMELVGMVSMGEYSDGCICRIPQQPRTSSAESADEGSVAGSVAAGAGVYVAMLARQQQAQHNAAMMHH